MRRADREIKDRREILAVMEQCDVVRIAVNDGEVPYVVPLNFGMAVEGDEVTLYFHSANAGKKVRLFEEHPKVFFEMDRGHRLYMNDEKMTCTMKFESVMGTGTVTLLPEEAQLPALHALMAHYHQEEFPFSHDALPVTNVYALRVETLTGKRR